ncbi:MAG: YraN family protein [Clostridia bacterium]|nr:YraN family protein [Clostridia bacterium]
MYTQKVGRFGEDEAVKYLKQKGYKILERNFSCKRGEIDIIALDKDEIVFIEIKARISLKYGLPSEAVTKNKLKHIYKTAEYYLYTRNLLNENTRIDVIEVYIKNKQVIINHLKQVV